ncbi:MAG: hypothetical protein L6R38_004612 [Xanthoria sp. 2 TBL-2021]|nr:MAG: hypothetical protein L6R38_004612 [Xanthoria sp. 2 TBL-2021]
MDPQQGLPKYLFNVGYVLCARDSHGSAWWRDSSSGPWREAVFHSTIRQRLINEASLQGQYRYSRKEGPHGVSDITSYHPTQDWGIDRDNRSPKIFQFYRNLDTEPSDPLEFLIWHGKIVLDFEGRPMRYIPALPATIGSKEDGCFLECMFREDPRITMHDFLSRMPATHPPMHYKPAVEAVTINLRRYHFRLRAGCINWAAGEISNEYRVQMEKLIPLRCLRANSTYDHRDLTTNEMRELKLATKKGKSKRARSSQASPGVGRRSHAMTQNNENKLFTGVEEIDQGYAMPGRSDHVPSIPQDVVTGVQCPNTEATTFQSPQTMIEPPVGIVSDTSDEFFERSGRWYRCRDWERDSHRWDDDEYEDMYFAILCAEEDDSLLATVGR